MPGKTGKRSRAPRPCGRCGKPIKGDFYRRPKADYDEVCFLEVLKSEKK